MPIFEYICDSGHLTEQVDLAGKRLPEIACGECGKPASRVQFSRGNWQFNHDPGGESNVSRAIGRVKRAGL